MDRCLTVCHALFFPIPQILPLPTFLTPFTLSISPFLAAAYKSLPGEECGI